MKKIICFSLLGMLLSISSVNAEGVCSTSSDDKKNIGKCVPSPDGGGDMCVSQGIGLPCSGQEFIIIITPE